jgi:hypothetical protein
MSRVVEIRDSRTIIVRRDGVEEVVSLNSVRVSPADEIAAARYLRKTLANAWVYIENGGDVYRSPDALYINDAMRRRAWTGMTLLSEADPLPLNARPLPRKKLRKRKPGAH